MTTFTREQFAFLVVKRARFVPAERIIALFAGQWKGTPCTLADIAAVDNLPDDWKPFFEAERAAFQDAPLGDKRNRIGKLNDWALEAEARNALTIAADLLEQIAKETSDAYAPKGAAGKGAATNGEQGEVVTITRTVVDPVVVPASDETENC